MDNKRKQYLCFIKQTKNLGACVNDRPVRIVAQGSVVLRASESALGGNERVTLKPKNQCCCDGV